MLLRNYDNIMAAIRIPVIKSYTQVSTDTDVFGDGHLNIKKADGTISAVYGRCTYIYVPFGFFTEGENNFIQSHGYAMDNLVCGGGDTPVTYDDYKLESLFSKEQIIKVAGCQKVTDPVYNEEDKTLDVTYSKTYMNKTSESITVKEIGVTSAFINDSGGYSTGCLVYRKVLDEPIEVPAGANFTLSFTTKVSANPNKPADYDATASVE